MLDKDEKDLRVFEFQKIEVYGGRKYQLYSKFKNKL